MSRVAGVQSIDGLTVESVVTVGDAGICGRWWVWRDARGQQVHAGMGDEQFVICRTYILVNGLWGRKGG